MIWKTSRQIRFASAVLWLSAASVLLWIPRAARAEPDAAPVAAQSGGKTIRLSYQLYGHGFHVLDVVASLRLTEDGYSLRVHDQTAGFMGLMIRANVTSTSVGRYVSGGVQPARFQSSGYSRGAQRDTVLDYVDGNPVVRVLTPTESNRDAVDIADAKGSIDSLSAMADMVHQVQKTGHCDGSALVFDGLRLTKASSRTAGQQTVPQDDRSPYGGTALRCDYVTLEIGGFLHDDEEEKMRKPQHGSAWVASILPDAPALPVRITFENPKLGMATMFLTKVEEFPASETGSQN